MDVIEMNIYVVFINFSFIVWDVENWYFEIFFEVVLIVFVFVLFKIGLFFIVLFEFVLWLEIVGLVGFVFFNCYLELDIDIEIKEIWLCFDFSWRGEFCLVLCWIVLFWERYVILFVVIGGVYGMLEIVKFVMVGVDVVMMVLFLLECGFEYFEEVI